MGQRFAKEKFFHEIDSNQPQKVKYILMTYPKFVNEYFDPEETSLPITKAAWLGYEKVIDMLLIFGCDINKKVKNGFSALFFAAERGHTKIVEKLINIQECKIYECDNDGYTPLDIAMIKGYYNCALLLKQKGLRLKSEQFYEQKNDQFVGYKIDYDWFIRNIQEEIIFTDKDANKQLFVKKEIIEHGVIDPNESWGDFFNSVFHFRDPKIVPINKLPKDYDPQNGTLYKLKSVINWRNQNYLENFDKKQVQSEQQIKSFEDLESNKILNK